MSRGALRFPTARGSEPRDDRGLRHRGAEGFFLRPANRSDAEDAVQETLIRVYGRVDRLRILTSFAGWLMAIVRRECQRLARLTIGRVSLEHAAREDRLAWLPSDGLRRDLSRCVESLPESYREIVLLRDVEVLTIDAIAERLSLTREAVKARLHRARKLMREYLKGGGRGSRAT